MEINQKLIWRVGLGVLFLAAGFMKLTNPAGIIGMLGQLGFPATTFFGWLLILVEISGGIFLISGYQLKYSSGILGVVILTAILTANLKTITDVPMGTLDFFKNLVILSGLISLMIEKEE